jgi:hypothetical protein
MRLNFAEFPFVYSCPATSSSAYNIVPGFWQCHLVMFGIADRDDMRSAGRCISCDQQRGERHWHRLLPQRCIIVSVSVLEELFLVCDTERSR